MSRIFSMRVSVALAAATLGLGALPAGATTYKLSLNTSTVTATCSTQSGPGAATTITVKPQTTLAGSATIVVTLPGSITGGFVVTPPAITTLSTTNQAAGIQYSVKAAVGCVGMVNAATPTFAFLANTGSGAVADAPVTVTTTLTSTVSGLSLSSSLVTVNCVLNGGNYTPGVAQNVSLTSTATGGTPYNFVTTSLPPGVAVTPSSGGAGSGTAGSTATTLSFAAATGCGGGSLGTTTGSLVLNNSPGAPVTISVILQITPISPLAASPSPASLTYTKGSGQPGTVAVTVTSGSSPAPFFTVDTTSLPSWLTVDAISGTVPKSLHFSSTSVCDSLAPGTYSAAVRLKVSGYGDLPLSFSLLITNPAPKLTVAQGTTQALSWTMGQSLPAAYITLISTDSPIPYTLTSGGPLAPVISSDMASGLAYSFGTQIPITFNATVFAAAQPASVLTGTVTVTWGSPSSTTVVTFNVTVQSPQATLASISPASLPTAASGTQPLTVVLTGTGFVQSSDPTQKTKVGVVSSNVLVQDTNIGVTVSNASNIILSITPTSTDTYLPFTAGGTVILGVCNPQGLATCTVPSATITLSIGNGPIIQGVASASSFQEVSPGQMQSIAPYDMISIFGTNFCSSSAPACSSSQVLAGVLNSSTMVYQNWLSMDAVSSTQRKLAVAFCPTGTTPLTTSNTCVNAPLLFATNSQINLMVPSSLSTGGTIDIIVSYGYGTASTTMLISGPVTVNVVSTDPGTFAIGADGQGAGAILAADWSVVGATNPAGMRSTAADSDPIQIYMTGLGAPDSQATNASPAGGSTAPTDCISIAAYLSSLNTRASSQLSSVDGAVVQSSLLYSGKLPPCLSTNPTVTIGTVPVTSVGYAGWVADSVAGLYQINVTLPGTGAGTFIDVAGVSHTTITAPVQLPVVVTAGSRHSQSGITVWVAPRLKVAPPTALSGQVGVAWANTNNLVVASEGTAPYRYAVTSGVLPAGLSLAATGASGAAITGTPAADRAGSYVITVTATDSANIPLTGTTTFTLTIVGGLVLTSSPASYTGTVVTSNTNIMSVTATGGAYPYTYSWDSSFTVPNGMTIGANSGAIGITSQTPAGVYTVKVDAVDNNGWQGTITFTVTLHLVVSVSSTTLTGASPNLSGNGGTSYAVNLAAVGGTSYTFTTPTQSGFTISGNVLTVNANASNTPYTVVINASDVGGGTGSITLSITLGLTVTASAADGLTGTSPNFAGTGGNTYTVNLAATGGTSYTFTTPTQTGFTISGNVLTVTAPQQLSGPYSVVITATDSGGATGTITLSITMN